MIRDALVKAGHRDEAVESYRKALEIRRTLAKDENNVNAQIDLVLSLVKAADVGDDTLAHVTEANRIVQTLNAQEKLPASDLLVVDSTRIFFSALPDLCAAAACGLEAKAASRAAGLLQAHGLRVATVPGKR